jgi:protein-tyrosine phosphatase
VAPLAGQGLAERLRHLAAEAFVEAGEALLEVAEKTVDVHSESAVGVSVPPGPRTIGAEEEATARERILFICTANVDRSRTAEDLYQDDERYEIRSRGVAKFATTELTRDDLDWAERVFVMDEKGDQHKTLIQMRFGKVHQEVIDLEIEDLWRRNDPELRRLLLRRLKKHLGAPRSGAGAGIMGESSEEG